ncbi:MAG: hypothetical protein ACRDDP_05490, partial [Plesiomonas sp.]
GDTSLSCYAIPVDTPYVVLHAYSTLSSTEHSGMQPCAYLRIGSSHRMYAPSNTAKQRGATS